MPDADADAKDDARRFDARLRDFFFHSPC